MNRKRFAKISPFGITTDDSKGSGSSLKQGWATVLALGIIIFFGAILRLHDLGKSTITHPEIFVPGIELPSNISAPPQHLTVWETLTVNLARDVHPPAYYILMFGWTKLFGTGILSLRLPSVLFGVSSILLIYCLGSLTENKFTALLAAGMLSLNGHHIFWSQEARMYSMACALGLLSTVLLLLISKDSTRQKVFLQFLYLVVTLIGLATQYYFWPFFFTHVLWIVGINWTKPSMPSLFRLQIFILILGSPLVALAAYQSRTPSYLGRHSLIFWKEFLQFGFLFEPGRYYVPTSYQFYTSIAAPFLVPIALFLLVLSVASRKSQPRETASAAGSFSMIIVVTGVFVFLGILLFARFAYAENRVGLIIATSVIPILLPFVDIAFRRYWNHFQKLGIWLNQRVGQLGRLSSLNFLLAILPLTMVTGISVFVPFFASRAALLYSPYLIIILCIGLTSLVHLNRHWIVLVLILAVFHSSSVVHFKRRLHAHIDYKSLAEPWVPKIKGSDLIFVRRHWITTPIFYYLKGYQGQLIGADYSEAVSKHPGSRVWVLSFDDLPMTLEGNGALEGYRVQETEAALGVHVTLYAQQR